MTAPHRHRKPAEPPLLFCANCQVSIAAIEFERGTAKRTPRGRMFCTLCTRAKPTERETRRRALEQEFADDAPIVDPAPVRAPERAPQPSPEPAPAPVRRVAAEPDVTVADRVGQLERTLLRMQEQIFRLEERLDSGSDA